MTYALKVRINRSEALTARAEDFYNNVLTRVFHFIMDQQTCCFTCRFTINKGLSVYFTSILKQYYTGRKEIPSS